MAGALGKKGSTLLAGPERPVCAPSVLWRRADPLTGADLKYALYGARRIFVVVDHEMPRIDGLVDHLAALELPGVMVNAGATLPQRVPAGFGQLRLGWCWGREEPLVAAWLARSRRGQRIWGADPGVFPVVPMSDAVAATLACVGSGPVDWQIPGSPACLMDLARRIGPTIKVPLSVALRREGIPSAPVRTWLQSSAAQISPAAQISTPGWVCPDSGPKGWTE